MSIEKLVKMNAVMTGMFKIIYLNLLWMAFSIAGLGVFGFGPATYAISKCMDQWLRLKNHNHITKSFVHYYFENFWKSCLTGGICLIAFWIVISNLFLLKNGLLQIINMVFLCIFSVIFMFVFKVMVAIDFKHVYEVLRGALLLGFGYLFQTIIGIAIILIAYMFAARFVPILIVMFGFGFISLVQCILGNLVIDKVYVSAGGM